MIPRAPHAVLMIVHPKGAGVGGGFKFQASLDAIKNSSIFTETGKRRRCRWLHASHDAICTLYNFNISIENKLSEIARKGQ